MAPELDQYFAAERHAGTLAAALGAASLSLATYLWLNRSPLRAAAWPLVLVGLLELGVGVGLLVRTNPQVRTLEAGFRASPQGTAAAELQRMTGVNRSFRMIMRIEIVLLFAGALLAFLLRTKSLTWSAVGAGLALQAAVLLVFDLFAEQRAHVYTHWLSGVAGPGAGA